MILLLGFAFVSGLFTILAPCIWPILPIVLSSATSGGKRKPLGVVLGIMTTFTLFTLTISYIVKIIPFDPNILRVFAAVMIIVLGLSLIVPAVNRIVEGAVSRLSGKFGQKSSQNMNSGFLGGYVTGASLGILWAPCAGPILATIATLAATNAVSLQVIFVTIAYVIGVGIPLFIFVTVGNKLLSKTKFASKYTGKIQQVFGIIMIFTAFAILTNFDKVLQVKLLDAIPSYSSALTKFESNSAVTTQLDKLRGNTSKSAGLSDLGPAPEFKGISSWLNTENPLTLADLKGKVVLVDFWTYTCINCIRTLPYVTHWYDTYKDKGFVVIGVHTPEFEFEKNTQNVKNAIKQYNIHYPVAQDNSYGTWNAYQNRYWPAHYLIDAKGVVRETHFGEGNYEETERSIQALLKENGQDVSTKVGGVQGDTAMSGITPETYVGLARMERVTNSIVDTGNQELEISNTIPEDYISFGGTWNIQNETSITRKNASLSLNFQASKVFLVITPKKKGDTVKVFIDNRLLNNDIAGADVKDGILTLDNPRLYDLVHLKTKQNHTLRLEFQNEDTECFAFTFG